MSSQNTGENWVEPRSLEEAIAWRDQVLAELQNIQDQLSDPERMVEARDMTQEEYRAWRGRAKVALKYKLAAYRRLKAWVQLHRSGSQPPVRFLPLEEMNPVQLATQLRGVTGQLYAVFRSVETYLDDRSADNLRTLAAHYEQAAAALGSTPHSPTRESSTQIPADASSIQAIRADQPR